MLLIESNANNYKVLGEFPDFTQAKEAFLSHKSRLEKEGFITKGNPSLSEDGSFFTLDVFRQPEDYSHSLVIASGIATGVTFR